MQVKVKSRGFSLSKALHDYVLSKIHLNLSRYSDKLSKVEVILFDVNGPKGGECMCCKIVCKPIGGEPILIEETTENLYDAINSCSHRLKRNVNRHFNRAREFRKIKLSPVMTVESSI